MSFKISVIIPAFNAEQFIENAINSVLMQKYSSDLEIIVIDDRSSDDTRAVVSNIANQHQQVKLLSNDRTKGPSGARNTGLLHASGKYITFLDADDLWLDNHIEHGVDFLEKNTDIDIVFFNFEIHEYESKKKVSDWFSERSFTHKIKTEELYDDYFLICDDMFSALLDESFMHLQSMIVRNTSINNVLFREDIKRAEDRDFSIQLYRNSEARFAYKDLITGIYYRHGNSLTTNTVDNSLATILDHIYLFKEYLSYNQKDNSITTKLKQLLLKRHITASYYYRVLNQTGSALRYLFQSYLYGISVSQHKEFAKIIVGFIIHKILNIKQH